jgi:hypothetical protein
MTIAFKTADSFSDHAWCMAAGIRDGLRTAQFYIRDMSNADGKGSELPRQSTFLSQIVADWARMVDKAMTWGGNTMIALVVPQWRHMPSPFSTDIVDEVAKAISQNKLLENPLFNAYFFRACQNIVNRWSEPPYLVLEHRIDAARRALAGLESTSSKLEFLSRALLALVEAAPIARHGILKTNASLLRKGDPNVAVCATACIALKRVVKSKELARTNFLQSLAH